MRKNEMKNTNKLTKENMMNELNEYGYNESNLYEMIEWYYEVEEINSIEDAYNIVKKMGYKEFTSMVNDYYVDYEYEKSH